jgi:hypothetical protein
LFIWNNVFIFVSLLSKNKRIMKDLLKKVYENIDEHSIDSWGFCALVHRLCGIELITIDEMVSLTSFFKDIAHSTNYVTQEHLDSFCDSESVIVKLFNPSDFLYTPADWESRKKWLNDYLDNN